MIKSLAGGILLHLGPNEVPVDIAVVEQKKNAKFVGEFCLKDGSGNWVNAPCQLYWQKDPPAGYSNYFAIFVYRSRIMIASGEVITNSPITAVVSSGDAVYSKYRWNAVCTPDGRVCIDGGRDYTKITGTPNRVISLGFDGPNIVIIE